MTHPVLQLLAALLLAIMIDEFFGLMTFLITGTRYGSVSATHSRRHRAASVTTAPESGRIVADGSTRPDAAGNVVRAG